MSLQSNFQSVKEEFKSDEKMLENAFRLEILFRRYRFYLAFLLLCIAGGLIWWAVSHSIQSSRMQAANAAYSTLVDNPKDEHALTILKEKSPALYDLYLYTNANGNKQTYESLQSSQNAFVKTLANYEIASMQASDLLDSKNDQTAQRAQSIEKLDQTVQGSLKDFATLQSAYLLLVAGEINQAHQKLLLISQDSPFKTQAMLLKHYGIQLK